MVTVAPTFHSSVALVLLPPTDAFIVPLFAGHKTAVSRCVGIEISCRQLL